MANVNDAADFLGRTMPHLNVSRADSLEVRHASRADEVALPLLKDGFTRRRDLLLECCEWSKGIVFQRLELLGDAFLQFAVSFELRKRYPGRSQGELTTIR